MSDRWPLALPIHGTVFSIKRTELVVQVNSRSQPAEAAAGGEASGDRETQLLSQLKLLQEELSAAYEKAAQATSHVSQFKALAESSDQALAAMQVKFAHCPPSCCFGSILFHSRFIPLQGFASNSIDAVVLSKDSSELRSISCVLRCQQNFAKSMQ